MAERQSQIDGCGSHVIARDYLTNGYLVSTVERNDPFLRSMDSLIGTIQPLVGLTDRADLSTPGDFETMVFEAGSDGEPSSWTEQDFARYETREAAIEGHERIVEKWLKT